MVSPVGATTRRAVLDGQNWQLWYAPDVDRPAPKFPGTDPAYTNIPAIVPGAAELDLVRAGVLADPFVGENLREVWKLEYGDWWYRTEFTLPHGWDMNASTLLFEGLDTLATVYVNGHVVGRAENMLIAHEIDLAGAIRGGSNELVVHLRSPLAEAERHSYPANLKQIWDNSESLWIRKPAHMYGWDITPRMVSAGIFRSVQLLERPGRRVSDWYLSTRTLDTARAEVELHYELSFAPRSADVRLTVTGVHGRTGKTFSATGYPTFVSGRLAFTIDEPELWMPRSHGQPELYDVQIILTVDDEVTDRHETRWGLRTITLDWDPAPAPDGRFRVHVNGEPIMILGTNWVPLDALHARDTDRLPGALNLLDDSGCNAVRNWGGNLYESDEFYDWCDEHGVLVWQDFAFACARYPQAEPFLSAVAEEAESVVRRLRNHPSLLLWCGGNETDDSFADDGLDPWTDQITRKVLPDAVRMHDWSTPYIPNSPVLTSSAAERLQVPEQHLWGARAWFKESFYTETHAEFISEIGYHGMPAIRSLREFLPEIPPSQIAHDETWRLHESHHRAHPNWYYSRNQLLLDQAALYLDGSMDDLNEIVLASQLSQAEAMKFFIEQARLARGERWGIIWWNLLDAWPQISDAVVDYYGRRKLAFSYIARAQQPVCMMADEAEGWHRRVVLANDSIGTADITWQIRSARSGAKLAQGETRLPARKDDVVCTLPLARGGDCYLFTWVATTKYGRFEGGNHYTEGAPPLPFGTYRDVYLPQVAALAPAFDPDEALR